MKKGISLSQWLKSREENSWCSQGGWTFFVWIPSSRNKNVFLPCWLLLLRVKMIRLVLSNRSREKVVVLPFLFHWWNPSTFWSDYIKSFDIFWNQLWNVKCTIKIYLVKISSPAFHNINGNNITIILIITSSLLWLLFLSVLWGGYRTRPMPPSSVWKTFSSHLLFLQYLC